MSKEEAADYLKGLSDDDLWEVLYEAFFTRDMEFGPAIDDDGWPTREATLATIKRLICE